MSWLKAYKLCAKFGGRLPTLATRLQQEQMISLLRNIHNLSIVEALFIGLTVKRISEKV